jgi:hypothetical protein
MEAGARALESDSVDFDTKALLRATLPSLSASISGILSADPTAEERQQAQMFLDVVGRIAPGELSFWKGLKAQLADLGATEKDNNRTRDDHYLGGILLTRDPGADRSVVAESQLLDSLEAAERELVKELNNRDAAIAGLVTRVVPPSTRKRVEAATRQLVETTADSLEALGAQDASSTVFEVKGLMAERLGAASGNAELGRLVQRRQEAWGKLRSLRTERVVARDSVRVVAEARYPRLRYWAQIEDAVATVFR